MSGPDDGTETRYRYRYRVMGRRGAVDAGVIVLENFAYDLADAREQAAFRRRWGWTAWVERQLIVEPPAWERV